MTEETARLKNQSVMVVHRLADLEEKCHDILLDLMHYVRLNPNAPARFTSHIYILQEALRVSKLTF